MFWRLAVVSSPTYEPSVRGFYGCGMRGLLDLCFIFNVLYISVGELHLIVIDD